MNEADISEIRWHLIEDPIDTRRTALLAFHHGSLIAVKLDLNMCRFGQNCDDVSNKRGDQATGDALEHFDQKLARELRGSPPGLGAAKPGWRSGDLKDIGPEKCRKSIDMNNRRDHA